MTAQNCLRSVSENNSESEFILYPNPAKDFITIESELPFNKIVITNILSQKILEMSTTKTVDVSELNAGIYLLKILDANEKQLAVKYFVKE